MVWPLYDLFWWGDQLPGLWPNANCLIAGGKGASAAAAWAAHKAISLPKVLSRVIGVAGAGGGLTARGVGDAVGVESGTTTTTPTRRAFGPPPGGWVMAGSPHNHVFSAMQTSAFQKMHIKL